MDEYREIAAGFRQLRAAGKITSKEAKDALRILDFLADCNICDLYSLIDTGAFNNIITCYLETALDDSKAPANIKSAAMKKLQTLLAEKTAAEVCKNSHGSGMEIK